MACENISLSEIGYLSFSLTKMNSEMHKRVLKENFYNCFSRKYWIFQHNIAQNHKNQVIKTPFQCKNTEGFERLPKNPDLNTIENLWYNLVRYAQWHYKLCSLSFKRSVFEEEWCKLIPYSARDLYSRKLRWSSRLRWLKLIEVQQSIDNCFLCHYNVIFSCGLKVFTRAKVSWFWILM